MESRRLLILAALVVVLAPVAAGVALLLGGTAIPTCLGGTIAPCWGQTLVIPFIRTVEGIYVSLAICGAAWLAANGVILRHLMRVNRRHLARLVVAVALFALAMAGVGFVDGLQQRLRAAAEGAVTWGISGLALAWVVGLAWTGFRGPRRLKRTDAAVV